MAGIEAINDYRKEIAILEPMFGGTISAPVIASVLESCNGDINVAADVIMNFDNETTSSQSIEAARQSSEDYVVKPAPATPIERPAVKEPPILTTPILQEDQAPSVSYSEAFRNTGAVPKRPDPKISKSHNKSSTKPDRIENILEHHRRGDRILIFMRGAPGSGKTYLAERIIENAVGRSFYANHIFSTDDFFIRDGIYRHDKSYLSTAHAKNQKRVFNATNNGLSPIIVDNTNLEHWEMEPYARDAVRNGYIIEIIEPKTPWAKIDYKLAEKNIHQVPQETIRRMLDRGSLKITPKSLIQYFGLVYPIGYKPPVNRLFPPILSPDALPKSAERTSNKVECDKNNLLFGEVLSKVDIVYRESPESPDEQLHSDDINKTAGASQKLTKIPGDDGGLSEKATTSLLQKMTEAQNKYDQFEKVEKEWDNGESWDSATKNITVATQDLAIALEPKPPREAEKSNSDKFIGSASICDDWTKISMFMPPWQGDKSLNLAMAVETLKPVETKSIGTCLEAGDRSGSFHKVLYGKRRNINEDTPDATTKIKTSKLAKVMMLDKGSSTHENDLLTMMQQCPCKEHHFRILRRLCKHVPRNILRGMYEDCNCDVDWTYNLVLDGYTPMPANFVDNEDDSDTEEETIEGCDCFASFNTIPNMIPILAIPAPDLPVSGNNSPGASPMSQKKPKREIKMSDSSLKLKRQIESNVIISDNHYSQHYLNMRRRRENAYDGASKSASVKAKTEDVANASDLDKVDTDNAMSLPVTNNHSSEIRDIAIPSTSQYNFHFMDSTDSDSESDKSEVERTVPVNLGFEFLSNLDEIFGRKSFQYPENIKPIVNLPMSLLREINAHWATSVAYQMDYGSKQSEEMIKQDEDFARQVAAKEQEMTKEGKEPDVPTLKEIMDMDLAYSIYERNVAEWRNNEPQDLAARLSREKLYNLFPDLSKEILSEMLMAHDYSFKSTIEILLVSTGHANWLQDEKGVEKFVMEKEMERKEKFLAEQNKNLMDVEWPLLTDSEHPITLETVNHYRAQAERSLLYRNANYEKAKQYFARNSPSAASFYSDIASLHTKKYEQSTSLAAAYLMNYHLRNNPDTNVLDLHYLRVAEAMVNLDLFLDGVILNLRHNNLLRKEVWVITGKGKNSKGGPRIKPATKRRLQARDIVSKEVNGGLLSATLQQTNKMTDELAQFENA